jgi:hypothetical protein
MYVQLYRLCSHLSPDWRAPLPAETLPWLRILLALFATQAMLLACALRMLLSRRIVWARTVYERHGGRVRVVARLTE